MPAGGLQPHPAADGAQVQHAQAGLWWPAADPGKLREAATAWRSLAADLESVSRAASVVIGGVAAQNQGQAIDSLEAYWQSRWVGGSGALPAVTEGARALADGLERYAVAVEQARARIQELIAATATVVIVGVALTVLTVGMSDVAAGAVAGSLIAAAAAVGIELSTEVAAIIATALVFTGMGALEGGLSDLAIQWERVGYFHDQASVNWNEVLQWAETGALTGAAGAGLRTVVQAGAPTVGRIGARLGVAELPAWASTPLARRVGSMAGGAAAGAGTAALTDEVTTGHVNGPDVIMATFAGASGGWIGSRPGSSAVTIRGVDDVLRNPELLKGMSPGQLERAMGSTQGWVVETLGRGGHTGQGWLLRQYTDRGQTGRMIRWHPGGGHHGPDPYWRVTSGESGKSGRIAAGPNDL